MKEFGEAAGRGRANAEAIELTRRHCRHARIHLVGGNIMAGSMLGLPMGLMEVRYPQTVPVTEGEYLVPRVFRLWHEGLVPA